MKPTRQFALAFAGLLLCAGLVGGAGAQSFPTKPVKVIAAYPTGSGPDAVLRLIGDRLTKMWGHRYSLRTAPPPMV